MLNRLLATAAAALIRFCERFNSRTESPFASGAAGAFGGLKSLMAACEMSVQPIAAGRVLAAFVPCAECGQPSMALLQMLWIAGEFRCPFCGSLAELILPPVEEWNADSIAWGRAQAH